MDTYTVFQNYEFTKNFISIDFLKMINNVFSTSMNISFIAKPYRSQTD